MSVDVIEKLKLYIDVYTLETIKSDLTGIVLRMKFKSKTPEDIYTKYYPNTFDVLTKHMPSVLETVCFNENNYTFMEEVLNTELGHLFEHILIQKMTDIKAHQDENTIYNGYTSWNWETTDYGTFDIWVSVPTSDTGVFDLALVESIDLFNKIVLDK